MQRFGKFLPLMVIALMVGLGFGSCKTDETNTDTDSGNSGLGDLMGIEVKRFPGEILETYQGKVPASGDATFLEGLEVEVTYANKKLEFTFPDGVEQFKNQEGGGEGKLTWNPKTSPTVLVDISVNAGNVVKHDYVSVNVKQLTKFSIVVNPETSTSLRNWYLLGASQDEIKNWFKERIEAKDITINAQYGSVTQKVPDDIPIANIIDELDFTVFDLGIVGSQKRKIKLFGIESATPIEAVVLPLLPDDKEGREYTAMESIIGGEILESRANGYGAFSKTLYDNVTNNGAKYYIKSFQMGKYEIPYVLWYGVINWATAEKGYYFTTTSSDSGVTDDTGYKPAMDMTWLEAAVWCNAYTELMNEIIEQKIPTPGSDNSLQIRLRNVIPSSALTYVYIVDKDSTKPLRSTKVNGGDIVNTNDVPLKVYINHNNTGFRLPDEAEWEWAARGGQWGTDAWNFTYAGSNTANKVAKVDATGTYGIGSLAPVRPGKVDLYDMTGNVWEWCIKLDRILASTNSDTSWGNSYTQGALNSSAMNGLKMTGTPFGVAKGASFEYPDTGTDTLKLDFASQSGLQLNKTYGNLGFRIVRSNK